jgi:hypothetical protein
MTSPTIKSLTTDSVNLSLRVTAIMRNIGYADCEEDVEVFKTMALSFSLELTKKLRELERTVYPGVAKND